MQKTRLYCFPYAGGSAMIYHRWKKFLHAGIDLFPVELAGRGRRIHEGPYHTIHDAIEDVWERIKDTIGSSPYALFGHSMGTIIAYELAQKMRKEGRPAPLHIFFSGRSAPHLQKEDEEKYYSMNDDDFRQNILKLGGTPPEIFEYPALTDFFVPLLRNDFKITEAYSCEGEIYPLDCDVTVFSGRGDDVSAAQCEGWREHTNRQCHIHYFDGGHFFLHEHGRQMVQIINETLPYIKATIN